MGSTTLQNLNAEKLLQKSTEQRVFQNQHPSKSRCIWKLIAVIRRHRYFALLYGALRVGLDSSGPIAVEKELQVYDRRRSEIPRFFTPRGDFEIFCSSS